MFKAKEEPKYEGAMSRAGEGYAVKPAHSISEELPGKLNADEHGVSTSYIVKKGEPFGEDAKFNHLPPGENLFAQVDSDLDRTRNMAFKEIVNSKGY